MYVEHPLYIERVTDGACIPRDPGNEDFAAYMAWVTSGNAPDRPAPPDLAARCSALLKVVDDLLNSAARAKGYDSIITAALRAGYPGPFHDEGVTFATWMDACYARCYEILAQFEAGEIGEPDAEALLGMLPTREVG